MVDLQLFDVQSILCGAWAPWPLGAVCVWPSVSASSGLEVRPLSQAGRSWCLAVPSAGTGPGSGHSLLSSLPFLILSSSPRAGPRGHTLPARLPSDRLLLGDPSPEQLALPNLLGLLHASAGDCKRHSLMVVSHSEGPAQQRISLG